MGARATPATRALEEAGVGFRLHEYHVGEKVGEGYGEAVAAAIGLPPERVFKTLLARVDGSPVVAIVPVAGRLSTKLLAAAASGKRAEMMSPGDAERLTGYVTGGISPIAQKVVAPAFIDESAQGCDTIAVSGGRRGIQLELTPADLARVTGARSAPLTTG